MCLALVTALTLAVFAGLPARVPAQSGGFGSAPDHRLRSLTRTAMLRLCKTSRLSSLKVTETQPRSPMLQATQALVASGASAPRSPLCTTHRLRPLSATQAKYAATRRRTPCSWRGTLASSAMTPAQQSTLKPKVQCLRLCCLRWPCPRPAEANRSQGPRCVVSLPHCKLAPIPRVLLVQSLKCP
jgi:hypothetical protein